MKPRVIIGKVRGYKNPYGPQNFRLEMRTVLKEKMSDRYFQIVTKEYKLNLGCYLFGKPNAWKGVLGLDIKSEDEVHVWYDNFRMNEDIKDLTLETVYDIFIELKNANIINSYTIISN